MYLLYEGETPTRSGSLNFVARRAYESRGALPHHDETMLKNLIEKDFDKATAAQKELAVTIINLMVEEIEIVEVQYERPDFLSGPLLSRNLQQVSFN